MGALDFWKAGTDITIASGTALTAWLGLRISKIVALVWKSKVAMGFYHEDQEKRAEALRLYVQHLVAHAQELAYEADREAEDRIETNNKIRSAQVTARLDILNAKLEGFAGQLDNVEGLAERLLDATLGRRNGAK